MSDGMLYALMALTIVILVMGGYIAYLARRSRSASQELKAVTGEAPDEPREGDRPGEV